MTSFMSPTSQTVRVPFVSTWTASAASAGMKTGMLRDAVLYRLLLLGEIATALPDSLRDRSRSIPDVPHRGKSGCPA
jgi:uncharacterized protein with HEPN domain